MGVVAMWQSLAIVGLTVAVALLQWLKEDKR